MAGFTDGNTEKNSVFERIRGSVRDLSNFGMRYNDLVIRNSMAIGTTEASFLKKGPIDDETLLYSLGRQDTTTRQYISYFDKDYEGKKDYLRKFSLNPEIEFILDLICDDAISYDKSNHFAYPSFLNLTDASEKLKEKLELNFEHLYDIWGFSDDTTAWHYFRQYLIEGFLSFEIIYNDSGKKIVGFKELDSFTISPSVEKTLDGKYIPVWIQYPDDPNRKRILYDSQIIYLSYAKGNTVSRLSYTERLIRPYNILRIMEYTRVIWSVMNASFRMKMTVPIGTRSPQKSIQTLGELMNIYKEDIRFNDESGELTIDGRPKIQFYKNYMMPSGVNGTPTIEPINTEGPNLNDLSPLAYFWDKLIQESKIPSSRFQGPDGGSMGAYQNSGDGLDKEEIRFSKFINRLRSSFQDIIIKPLWIQMCNDIPSLKEDYLFKSQLGLDYFSDNPFRLNQEMDSLKSRRDAIISMLSLVGDEGNPYFSSSFLVEKYLGLSDDDIIANKEAKKRSEEKKKKDNESGEEEPKE